MNKHAPIDVSARRRARRTMIQALYQWHLTHTDIDGLLQQFLPEVESKAADIDYFKAIFFDLFNRISELDTAIVRYLNRALDELTVVEHSVLRLAVYELIHCHDIPYKVVIDEALELNKRFGTKDGHKFVNGVLDKVAKQHRVDEIGNTSLDG